MTTRSPSPRPEDTLIATAPTDPSAEGSGDPRDRTPDGSARDSAEYDGHHDPVSSVPVYDTPADGDPLHGLVHAAVADRPLEDVVRLLGLLERSPGHARTTASALRALGTERSVEDVTRLVALLTEPPRKTDSADELIRAAAEGRPLAEVSRLVRLLHRGPVEPHCGQAAIRAVAVHRPVEELAELIDSLATEGEPPERSALNPADSGPTGARSTGFRAADAPFQQGRGTPPRAGWPAKEPATQGSTIEVRAASVPSPSASAPLASAPASAFLFASASVPATAVHRAGGGRAPAATVWAARCAALLVFLCGLAHLPRYWTGLSHGSLGTTLLASALCGLLALALTARTAPARLVGATASAVLTAALAAGQVFGARLGLPDVALPAATLAPPWLAGPVAVTATAGALAVLLTAVTARRTEGAGAG
ncbi:hypothetical protein ACH4NF_02740 [Streptomyces sp. NPDC017248]|uniref:hypothetical protein n=1 Tax=unclassified Streptomyces TaxID=2593676 RepID=UPI0037B38F61